MDDKQETIGYVVDGASVYEAREKGVSAMKVCEYAVYRGDDFITVGTAKECAEYMGWSKPKNTQFYASPTYQKRVKPDGNGLVVIKLEEDEEE